MRELKVINSEVLEANVLKIQEAMTSANRSEFIEGLHHISKELEKRQWVFEKTKEYLKYLNAIPGVLVTKGCGALGADVVLAVVEKSKSVLFEALLKDEGKSYFSRHHISKGLDIYIESEIRIEPYDAGFLP